MNDELAVIAQRAQAFTNASGAAVALSEGVEDEIVCKARSGSSAPEIGAVLRVEGTFTGVCIQSGRELRCDDTETDTRVDTVAVRTLGIRSMVITPIKEDNRAIGVLAVFASTPHAFTITHVAVLKTMADQISGLLQKERRAREEGMHPEPPPTLTRIPATPAPGPVAIRPPAPVPVAVPLPVRPVTPINARVEPIRPVSLAADVAAPVAFPRREESRPEVIEQPVLRANFGTFDSMAEQSQSGGSKRTIFLLLILVAAGAAGTWYYLKVKRAQNSAAQSVPAVTAPVAAQPVPDANATPGNGSAPGTSALTATAPAPVVTSREVQPATATPVLNAKRPGDDVAVKTVSPEKPSPSTPAPVATVALAGGPSKIAVNSQSPPPVAPVSAPNLTVGGTGSSALTALSRPVTTAAPAANLEQSQLVDVQLIRSTPPTYPAIARARRVTGSVNLKVRVGKDGKVVAVQFLDGPDIFKDAAVDSVRQWQYKPATLNGKPIEQEIDIKLNFKP
jgi:TonB family protein